jgi:hypothetical protein
MTNAGSSSTASSSRKPCRAICTKSSSCGSEPTLRNSGSPRGVLVAGSGAKVAVSRSRGRMPDLTVYLPGAKPPQVHGLIDVRPSIAVEVVSSSPSDQREGRDGPGGADALISCESEGSPRVVGTLRCAVHGDARATRHRAGPCLFPQRACSRRELDDRSRKAGRHELGLDAACRRLGKRDAVDARQHVDTPRLFARA